MIVISCTFLNTSIKMLNKPNATTVNCLLQDGWFT